MSHDHEEQEERLERAFMRSMLASQQAILHKLDAILKRLPEPKGSHMDLKFGQPKTTDFP